MALLTPDVIARIGLVEIEEAITFINTVFKGYASEWAGSKKGDTIRIKKATDFTAKDYTGTLEFEKPEETSVSLTIDKHLYVAAEISSKDRALTLEDFNTQIGRPAIKRLVTAMESYTLEQIKKCTNYAEHITGAPASIKDLSLLEAQAFEQNFVAGEDIFYLMNPLRKAELVTCDNGKAYDASVRADGGSAFRTANFGQVMGLNGLVSNLIPKKVLSTAHGETGTITANVNASKEAIMVSIDGITGKSITEGDILVVTKTDGSIVKASVKTGIANTTGTADAVEVFKLNGNIEAGDDVEVVSVGYGFVYQTMAVALASIPMDPLWEGETDFFYDQQLGLAIRVTFGRKELDNVMIFDTLAGADLINDHLGIRVDD